MTLTTKLHQLERSQLVRRADEPTEAYIFKHVLVQETAYASLLKGDRQRLHRSVAECIERAEPDRLDENAARLEQHYATAGDHVNALAFARRAGAYAAHMFANSEAVEHFTFALALLHDYGGSADEYQSVYLERGRALQEAGAFERALENYDALRALGRARNDPSLELAGLLERATLHAIPSTVHDPTLGARLNEQALELARAQQDRRAECKALWNLLLVTYFEMEPALSVSYGEQALALARELGWQELEAYILNDMARPLVSLGPPERVLALLEQARVLYSQQNNLPMLADNLAAAAQVHCFYGNYEQSRILEEQAAQLAHTINNSWALGYSRFSSIGLGMIRGQVSRVKQLIQELENLPAATLSIMTAYGTLGWLAELDQVLGDYQGAVAHSAQLVTWAKTNFPLGRAWTLGHLVRDLALAGKLDEAQTTLELAHREKLTDFFSFGPMSVAIGEAELALALGDAEWALRVMNDSIGKLEQLGIQFYLPAAGALRGRALAQLNRYDEAVEAFTRVCEIGGRIPARLVLWETCEVWANLEAKCGNAPRALELRVQASGYVMYIANQWDTPALRNQFLHQPRVRALFESIAAASA